MTLVVHDLAEEEFAEEDVVVHGARHPGGRRVFWMQKEVHREEAEDGPVVGAILDDVGPGHGVVTEAVHEDCFVLSLEIVNQGHGHADFLSVY